jgi:2,4'-dihydroxyacetophenone dioxygenase
MPAASKVQEMLTLPYPRFRKVGAVPWKPWVMPGVSYKLLSVHTRSNGFTCLLKVEPGVKAPVHHHLGAIEVLVLEGDIYYHESDIGAAGDYIFEPMGDIHEPVSPRGCTLFCVFYGPIVGLDDDASIIGVLDGKTMLKMAQEHGVAQHVAEA